MNLQSIMNIFSRFLPVIILISAVIGLAIRLIPQDVVFGAYPRLEGVCDTWFLLTQVETMVDNYPMFSWFYPGIGFPEGLVTVEMNPLLPFIASTILILTGRAGSGTATDISVISFIPVVCYLLLIPIMYYFGRRIGGKGTGIIAAALICVVPSILSRTTLGYLDHHCLEILLSAGFCYFFITLISTFFSSPGQEQGESDNSLKGMIYPALPAAILFGLGILNVITMMVFFAIATIVLTIGYVLAVERLIQRKRVLISYCTVFFPSSIILIFLGVMSQSSVVMKTFGMLAWVLVLGIVWIWCIDYLRERCREKPWRLIYPFIVLILAGVGVVFSKAYIPASWDLVSYFFAYPYILNLEWAPLSPEGFFYIYGISVILVLVGILCCLQRVIREKTVPDIFLLLWFAFFFIASIQHQRHLYYMDISFVILASIGLVAIWKGGGNFIGQIITVLDNKSEGSRQVGYDAQENLEELPINILEKTKSHALWFGNIVALVLFLCIIFQFSSPSYAWVEDDWKTGALEPDFIDAMTWLNAHSPDPVINPFHIYYPGHYLNSPIAYSVITPWVYGYAANYWSKRPVSTSGNKETNGALVETLYGSHNQSYTDSVMKSLGARYIVTSADFMNDEFPMYIIRGGQISPKVNIDDYIGFRTYTSASGEEVFYPEYYQPFYRTLAVHLHLLDGSYYPGSNESQKSVRSSDSMINPPEELEALSHFRLVYESGTKVYPHTGPVLDALRLFDIHPSPGLEKEGAQISRVKIFEYVNETEISGEGVVEIPVTTNQGRSFLYRQKSVNGMVCIPYDLDSD